MRRVRSSKVQSEGEALSPEMMDQESNLDIVPRGPNIISIAYDS